MSAKNVVVTIGGCIIAVLLVVSGFTRVAEKEKLSAKTVDATTKVTNQPFEVIDLGWRDVASVTKMNGSQAVVVFGIGSGVPLTERNNLRLATVDLDHVPDTMYCPILSKGWKKAYILEIRPNPSVGVPFASSSFVVKLGFLPSELYKAGLPR